MTPEQARTLRFIDRYIRLEEGAAPTLDEIRVHLGLRSKSGVVRLLDNLEARGFIRRVAHRARAIEVIRMPPSFASLWSPTSTLPDSDDLVWLFNSGDRTLDGPRAPHPEDADEFDWWAPCEAPLPRPEGAPS